MTQRERSAQAQPQTGTCRARTDLTGQGVPLTGVHTQTRMGTHVDSETHHTCSGRAATKPQRGRDQKPKFPNFILKYSGASTQKPQAAWCLHEGDSRHSQASGTQRPAADAGGSPGGLAVVVPVVARLGKTPSPAPARNSPRRHFLEPGLFN